ncbi:3-alpha domain-containing protein [Acinetobacter baumannii]
MLDAVLTLPLVDSWRRLFERRRQSGAVEDWAARLRG